MPKQIAKQIGKHVKHEEWKPDINRYMFSSLRIDL